MNLFRAFFTVGSYTMMSRILGFVRDILIAATLGAGLVADAFFVAFKLPNFFRRLFAEGAFNAGFVPLFTERLERDGKVAGRQFAEEILSVLLITLFVFVTLFQIFMPWAMIGLAPGFRATPEKFDLAVALTRITFPYLFFISLVSLLGGVLNTLSRFAVVAAAPILLNICLITAITVGVDFTQTPGHALAWGVAAAGAIQLAWLGFACQRAGFGLRLRWPRLTKNVKTLLKLVLPAAIGAGVVQINLVIDLILASTLPEGSVSFLFYADRLNQLPIGVVGVAVGTAVLPMLSRQIANGRTNDATITLNRAMELGLLLAVPAAAAFIAMPDLLIATLFQRGAFGESQTAATAMALVAYSTGLPAYILVKVMGPAFFARKDTKTPVIIASICVLVNIILNLILMQFLFHAGLALATALSAWLNILLMGWVLKRRGHMVWDARFKRRLPAIFLSAIVMAVGLWVSVTYLTSPMAAEELARILNLAVLVLAGASVFGLVALVSGATSLTDFKRLLKRDDG
jgi:putative peptidoglycan lipid II flippase